MKVVNHTPGSWSIHGAVDSGDARAGRSGRKRGSAAQPTAALLPEAFVRDIGEQEALGDAVEFDGMLRATREALDISLEHAADESVVLVVRDAVSDALSFHASLGASFGKGQRSASKARQSASAVSRFRVTVRATNARRGFVAKTLKLIAVKIKDALFDKLESAAFAKAGEVAEGLWWRHAQRKPGLFQVKLSVNGLQLQPAPAAAFGAQRALLLLHGTFSHARASFDGFATEQSGFLRRAQSVYGERIFAFDHFSVSRSTEHNARDLLAALPDRTTTFDVIAHSRGSLIVRQLCERRAQFGAMARRFGLGRAVLVASPNRGTPLATPLRWQETLGLVANLLELFPDNPWTTGADFVATGLLWLAKHITGDLPGLASMDANGPTIAALQDPPGPAQGSYSALGANFQGSDAIWQRLLDAGVAGFFASANDLVVPTEGAWLVDAPGAVIPAARIACFGPGGNLTSAGPVHHLNILDQPQAVPFLQYALGLGGEAPSPLDPNTVLPVRKLLRGAGEAAAALAPPEHALGAHEPPPLPAANTAEPMLAAAADYATDTLHLMILGPLDPSPPGRERSGAGITILAVYGSARVLEDFPTRNPGSKRKAPGDKSKPEPQLGVAADAGSRFSHIISVHKDIHMCLDGRADAEGNMPRLPDADGLRQFGELLFEALFVGGVRRLYDVARSEQRNGPLNVVLTCTVPWVAALPWEFACDPKRRKFLATEEVHFLRNVLTSVPAQVIPKRREPLRILIVSAQPRATPELAIADEEERLKHGFHTLIEAGLARVDVLMDTTPARLHDQIQAHDVEGQRYDIVHFIGHGEFDEQAESGTLLFLSSDGGPQPVDVRTLREILCGRGIHLVFLNACDTARDATQHRNRGVAQALVEGGLPAVVANQYKVLDSSAVVFSERFYWALALGTSLGQAAREARIAVHYSLNDEVIDWAVPVMYARDPGLGLCERWRTDAPKPVRRADQSAQAAVKAVLLRRDAHPELQPIRVAIADLPRYFDGLPEVIEELNAIQPRFVFQLARALPPLGVWEMVRDDTRPGARPKRYLIAERMAAAMDARRRALGVDYLACITDQRMCGGGSLDLYGWWSGKSEQPILIFSTWGLSLPTRGAKAGRVIANEIATGLAAQLCEENTGHECMHSNGPRDCPFYYNDARDERYITQRLRFDARCQKKLERQLPKERQPDSLLSALAALYEAYEPADSPMRTEPGSPRSKAAAKRRARSVQGTST